MIFEPLCWFLHESVTAHVGRRFIASATLVAGCAALALFLAGAA